MFICISRHYLAMRIVGRATGQRYELAPLHHSITSSARASSVGGTSMPSAQP
jgi:hypothetical protein